MRAEPLESTLKKIADLGYDQIEIQGSSEMYNNDEVKSLLNKYGLGCWGSVTLMLEERNLLARDNAQGEMSIQYVIDIAKTVKALGGSVISLVPSTVGKIVPEGRPDEDWENAINCIREIYKFTENEGLKIGIEPINRFETYFKNRGGQALALAKEVGPTCGVCLDAFHMNLEEDDRTTTSRPSLDDTSKTLITPHIGSLTKSTYDQMCSLSLSNLLAIVSDEHVDEKYLYNQV